MSDLERLPIAVIGAGPVGLAAAAHILRRGLAVKVYEAGASVGASVREWGHVQLFSPWQYNVDTAATALLKEHGWQEPAADVLPTGGDLYDAYLRPLAELPALASAIHTRTTVKAISRKGVDKTVTKGREARPFVLSVMNGGDSPRQDLARAVIDASGTWTAPNPLGAGGLPAPGEVEHADRIAYGLPDVVGRNRSLYAGQTTLVVGAGHSAANVLLDLARLARRQPHTSIVWAIRSADPTRVYGGGAADQLPARGALGTALKNLIETGQVTLARGFSVTAVRRLADRLVVDGETPDGPRQLSPLDRIVVATGQRPDLALTRELRLELDSALESTKALGPLIDPNVHSCGSVRPHGHRELAHPERGFYTVGVKSYGRAPTFLLATGYEQVRSVVAAIAGDVTSADEVRLVLPETGICSTQQVHTQGEPTSQCCGGPAPAQIEACCAADARAKAEEKSGCGCGAAA